MGVGGELRHRRHPRARAERGAGSGCETHGGVMDLTYSADDEQFRTALRAWLAVEVPRHGAPPPPGDWPARRAYDTAWQRKLFDAGYAGLQWPAEFGGR